MLRGLLSVMLLALGFASSTQAALIAHYKLDETSPGPVVNEVGADGTNFGATINLPGQIGQAYDFNRLESDRAIIVNPSVGAGSYSVSAWIRPETLAGAEGTWGMGIFRATTGEFVGDFFLAVSADGRLHFANWRSPANDPDGVAFTAAGAITASNWQHVAATWDGVQNRLYINGAEVTIAGTEGTGTGWGVESSIGREFASSPYHFEGLIDDVGVWDESLTADRLEEIYQAGLLGLDLTTELGGPLPEPASLVLVSAGALALTTARRRRGQAHAWHNE